jgi:hypothetical protein
MARSSEERQPVPGLEPAPASAQRSRLDGLTARRWWVIPLGARLLLVPLVWAHEALNGERRERDLQTFIRGYGTEHYKAQDHGGKDVTDVLDAGDYLASRSAVDPARLGIMGRSRGGMIILLAIERANKKFRAAVDVVGLTDFAAYMSYKPEYRRQDVAKTPRFGGTPFENLPAYIEASRWPTWTRPRPPYSSWRQRSTVRYNPRTQRIYAVHADSELAVTGARDYTIRSPIALPADLGAFKLEVGRPRMYINAKSEGVAAAIDSDNDRIIDRFKVAPAGVNAAVAIDEPNRRLFVGCRKNPSLVVMDSDAGKIVDSVPIPGEVDDLSCDARRRQIYASRGEGEIAVIRQIDADRYECLATIPTVKGARTSIFNTDDGHLYLAVPRRADRPGHKDPEVWIFQARP